MKTFMDGVNVRTGGWCGESIDWTVRATLRALGSQLASVPDAVGERLENNLRDELELGRGQPEMSPEALCEAVAATTGLRRGVAFELVQSVMAELGERVGPAACLELRRELSPAWVELVRDPSLQPRVQHRVSWSAPPSRGRTLATARPGSSRSLADAAPPGGQRNSLAENPDPHAERKLSSGR